MIYLDTGGVDLPFRLQLSVLKNRYNCRTYRSFIVINEQRQSGLASRNDRTNDENGPENNATQTNRNERNTKRMPIIKLLYTAYYRILGSRAVGFQWKCLHIGTSRTHARQTMNMLERKE